MPEKQTIVVEGIEFQSISEACHFYNISPQTFKYRLSKNLSIEEAMTRPKFLKFDSPELVRRDLDRIKKRAKTIGIYEELFTK